MFGLTRLVENLEKVLECADVNDSTSFTDGNIAAYIYKLKNFRDRCPRPQVPGQFQFGSGLANIDVPTEILNEEEENTIAFSLIHSPLNFEEFGVLDGRLYGISVSDKKISGLNQRINITVNLNISDDTKEPSCVFLDFSNKSSSLGDGFSQEGCSTEWIKENAKVVCSCNHLTYFAVLLVSPNITKDHAVKLTYISVIGCSISLAFLLLTVFLFLIQRQVDSDVSKKVHINLAIALILLNAHFLPSHWVASMAPSGGCVYIAIMLHYCLLATFSWMAIEGFHLYLLLVRVFNTYINRYLLKLGLLGWGIPAVVVCLILIIDKDVYGLVTVIPPGNDSNSTLQMCYINSDVVKLATTVGGFALVFVCNLGVLVVIVRLVLQLRLSGAPPGEKSKGGRMGRDACSLMAVSCMLGITWGLVFLSFSQLTLAGIYLFCILNSFQGFFISMWLCATRHSQSTQSQNSTETHSSKT